MYVVFPTQGIEDDVTQQVSFSLEYWDSSHPPQKESWRFNSTLRFPPSAHSCRAVLVCSHGELCRNKLWDNGSVGFRVPTSFTKRYTATRNYSMWLWRAHLRQWNQWAFFGLKGWACWRVCTPLSSSCQADFWDMLPREFARRKPAWIL